MLCLTDALSSVYTWKKLFSKRDQQAKNRLTHHVIVYLFVVKIDELDRE